ncbi:MAG TPA: Crp/Fnr family transcriptional regulator [Actinomycetales bacterium]|nr:Crp/Fnr family transcriptional regulator [Actinomycetales bacterium]
MNLIAEPTPSGHQCPMSVRLQVLADSPIFGPVDPQHLPQIDTRCSAHHAQRGDLVYRAGDPADALYVVAHGALKLTRPSVDGFDVLVDVVGPGDFLGMLTALGEATFAESATALTESCVLRFSAKAFRAVLNDHPQVTLAALDAVSNRLAAARQTVRELAADTAEQRIGAALMRLVESLGVAESGQVRISVPVTQGELASMAGTTPETVSRTLTRWRRDELVATGRGTITITDLEGLRSQISAD